MLYNLNKFFAYITATLFFSFLVACSSDDSSRKITDETGQGPSASCDLSATEGEAAEESLLTQPKIKTANYGKRYNQNQLVAIFKSSGVETAKFIQQTGTQLYRVDVAGSKGCEFFSFLQTPPADLLKIWNDVQGDKGNLLGLYLSTDPQVASIKSQPSILVKNKTDRYTLVHEFMHHNFTDQRLKDGFITDAELKSNLDSAVKTLVDLEKEYELKKDKETAQAYADQLILYAKTIDELMVRFTLEESAIEAILGEGFESKGYKNISEKSYMNGGEYILSTTNKYEEVYGNFVREIEKVSDFVFDVEIRQIFKVPAKYARQLFDTRKTEARQLVSMSEKRRRKMKALAAVDGNFKHEHAGQPCQHSRETEQLMEYAISVIGSTK